MTAVQTGFLSVYTHNIQNTPTPVRQDSQQASSLVTPSWDDLGLHGRLIPLCIRRADTLGLQTRRGQHSLDQEACWLLWTGWLSHSPTTLKNDY